MNQETTTVDIDLSSILNPEILINSAETEDDIGCIIRLHLQIEQILNFYINEARTKEISEFVKDPRDFGAKLSTAVALGFPIEFARVAKQINTIRNRIAHNTTSTITNESVKLLGQAVNGIKALISNFEPIERRFIEFGKKEPSTIYKYGNGNNRYDLVISAFVFIHAVVPWLIMRFAKNHIVKKPSPQEESTMDRKKNE